VGQPWEIEISLEVVPRDYTRSQQLVGFEGSSQRVLQHVWFLMDLLGNTLDLQASVYDISK